jgi:hypothetical protein
MKTLTMTGLVLLVLAAPVRAQEPPKPGPEHEILKKLEGNWDTVMKAGGAEFKGLTTYKMEVGGLWLVGTVDIDMGGMKFEGKSLETYDAAKKQFVSVWADSMSTAPMTMAGSYDKAKKALTSTGEGPGMDGKPTKYKSVTEMPDENTINMTMYMGDIKEPAFTVSYKRKK